MFTRIFIKQKINNKELNNLLKSGVDFAKQQNVKLPETTVTTQPAINTSTANIIFKVQIGAYKETVPTSTVTQWL